MRRRDRFAHVRTGWRARLGWRLRCWADRIDYANAPKIMSISFTFEDHRGLVIHEDGRGCPLVYLGDTHYGWAHEDSGQPGGWDRHGGERRKGGDPVSGDHVMVVPDGLPVRIGDGPMVATYSEDIGRPFMEVWVDGRKMIMDVPWPDPRPVPDTPYEAYACGDWTPDRFAIRLREDQKVEES